MNYFYITGWNTPASLLASFLAPLQQTTGITWTELQYQQHNCLSELYEYWQQQIGNEPCVIVAWSLGGNLAMDFLRQQSHQCQALVCIATNLNFVDDHFGMSETLFADFYRHFQQQPEQQHKRFVQMIGRGADKTTQKLCRAHYQSHQLSPYYLEQLSWLQSIKLCSENASNIRSEFWFGDGDLLVPAQAAQLFEQSQQFTGGHLCFLQQGEQCRQRLCSIIQDVLNG